MSDTVIAPDLVPLMNRLLAPECVGGGWLNIAEGISLIERVSKAEQENVALRDKVAKLVAPISDEEWASTKTWPKGIWRDNLDTLVMARGREGE